MIKLTINPDTQAATHSFHQNLVVIGSGADLSLPGENLEGAHVKIQEQDGRFVIINQANDPFVTLNNLPFGKKTLKEGDLIQIGNTLIRFAGEVSTTPPPAKNAIQETFAATDDKLQEIIEHAISSKASERISTTAHGSHADSPESFPPELDEIDIEAELENLESLARHAEEKEALREEEMAQMDIDLLLAQVEGLEEKAATIEPPPAERQENYETEVPKKPEPSPPAAQKMPEIRMPRGQQAAPQAKPNKGSLKDYYLSHLDDDTQQQTAAAAQATKNAGLSSRWNWRLIWILAASAVIFALLILGFIYLTMSGKNNEEELKAAEGVADVSMALTYAQMHHLKPQHQNWSDPEFIKTNLMAVLASEYTPAGSMDIHGQLHNAPYSIRIYTSSDLSQFVVIAQPAPSLLQWLLPRAAILVDSRGMEMRKIHDLKSLNRLLNNPSTLDGTSANEVSLLVKQGELIPLSDVASKAQKQGFSPPKALALIHAGTENLIYNAPRYYRFGEAFLKKASMIAESQSNSHDVEMLQQEMKGLSKYPNIVLYSSQGLQSAIHSQKALKAFNPTNKHLVGYLQFNSKGLVTGSHLLMDEGASDVAVANNLASIKKHSPDKELQDLGDQSGVSGQLQDPGKQALTDQDFIQECPSDLNNPLLLQLCSLRSQYQQKLFPLSVEFMSLMNVPHREDIIAIFGRLELLLKKNEQASKDDPLKQEKAAAPLQFVSRLLEMMKSYDQTYLESEEALRRELTKLYKENSEMSFSHFMEYVRMAGLEGLVDDHIKQNKQPLSAEAGRPKYVADQIQKIKDSKSLMDLNRQVEEIAAFLNLERIPDSKKLISYQTEARVQVLDKLNDFLLSNEKGLPENDFNDENRQVLAHILKTAWVTDPDEFDFYINEFEVRTHQTQEKQNLSADDEMKK